LLNLIEADAHVMIMLDEYAHTPGVLGFLRARGDGVHQVRFSADFRFAFNYLPVTPALNVEVLFEMRYTEWGVLTHYWGTI
jgi:hypothetical protein